MPYPLENFHPCFFGHVEIKKNELRQWMLGTIRERPDTRAIVDGGLTVRDDDQRIGDLSLLESSF